MQARKNKKQEDLLTVGTLAVVVKKQCNDHDFQIGSTVAIIGRDDDEERVILTCKSFYGYTSHLSPDELVPVYLQTAYEKGSRVVITSRNFGHEYAIGEVVTVIESGNDSMLCVNKNGVKWGIAPVECSKVRFGNEEVLQPDFKNVLSDVRRVNENDGKSIPLKFMKLQEELGELAREYLINSGHIYYKESSKKELTGEMSDALQVLLSIYCDIENEFGISIMDDVLPMVMKKNQKWESKIKSKP